MGHGLQTLKTVTIYSFKELWGSKILWNIAFLCPFIIIVPWICSQLSYGPPERIVLDMGLSSLSLSNIFLAFYLAPELVVKEYHQRTVYMIFSRPISKRLFLLGKFLSLLFLLLINSLILSAVALSMILFFGNSWTGVLIHQMVFFLFQGMVLMSALICFSLFMNVFFSMAFGLTVLIAGHNLDEISRLPYPMAHYAHSILSVFIPHFYRFDIQNFVLYSSQYEKAVTNSVIGTSYFYGLFITIFFYCLSCLIIERKELE